MEEKALIAEFDGLSKQLHLYERPITGEYVNPEDLEYDTSWDWLMPVVEKIESLPNGVIIEISGSYTIANGVDQEYYLEYGGNSKIENTYKAVVEFIKWYNLNKP